MGIKAVIDRIVDEEHAVLLVGEKETEKIIPVSHLPEGAEEGTWLTVECDGDSILSIELNQTETNNTRGRIKSKMELLRHRSKRRDK
ncbi:hypothetical protein J2S74_005523 [Evansella vedderi]|uniref:DUF3006 domain-containing protein n=1 Tax=Evansella vedderi TaxID=38282 RepID=A0ABU0A3I6_9BACI|nr:DUF3006 domain-containing protein [Evansella vedderi]MDQ0258059.1 hypothetical protein [Evansella vedderi]